MQHIVGFAGHACPLPALSDEAAELGCFSILVPGAESAKATAAAAAERGWRSLSILCPSTTTPSRRGSRHYTILSFEEKQA